MIEVIKLLTGCLSLFGFIFALVGFLRGEPITINMEDTTAIRLCVVFMGLFALNIIAIVVNWEVETKK